MEHVNDNSQEIHKLDEVIYHCDYIADYIDKLLRSEDFGAVLKEVYFSFEDNYNRCGFEILKSFIDDISDYSCYLDKYVADYSINQ